MTKRSNRRLSDIEAEISKALRLERKNIFEIGALLIEAKNKLEHGQWLPWLKKNFGKSESTARNYMCAAEWAAKNATVADLRLKPALIYMLATKQTPGYMRFGVDYSTVETAILADLFNIAKTQWVDVNDYTLAFQRAAFDYHRRLDAARQKEKRKQIAGPGIKKIAAPKRSTEKPEPKSYIDPILAEKAKNKADRIAWRDKIKAMSPEERAALEIENEQKSIWGNLKGAVNQVLSLRRVFDKLHDAPVPLKDIIGAANLLMELAEARGDKHATVEPSNVIKLKLRPTAVNAKIAKILGMMGSHHSDAANAARMADDIVKKSGCTWPEVLGVPN